MAGVVLYPCSVAGGGQEGRTPISPPGGSTSFTEQQRNGDGGREQRLCLMQHYRYSTDHSPGGNCSSLKQQQYECCVLLPHPLG